MIQAAFSLRHASCLLTNMILVIMHMKVSVEKRKELSQAVTSLLSIIRAEKGCRRCDFFHHIEDEAILCLLEEWDTRKNLETHYRSDTFKVLRGAMNLLAEPCEIISYQCLQPAGEMKGMC
jgi:quinol monooxygenase YgiN